MIARLRPLVALLLLALWLPATQHCGLEAAGLLAATVDCHAADGCRSDHDRQSCDADNCQSIESGAYKAPAGLPQLAAPLVLAGVDDLPVIGPEAAVVSPVAPARTNPPPELAACWRFIARAAPSPRAPSLAS